jgi:hypothetical protein
MQLWVVHHLLSQTPFDIWDLMVCEMEDTLTEGFKGHRQLPYAHWICFIIRSALELPLEISAEITETTTVFLSMIFVSYRLQLLESRPLHQDRERDLRCLRQRLSRMRPYRVMLRQNLQI